MNLAAISHSANSNYCYPINNSEILLKIKCPKDSTLVKVYYGDPYDYVNGKWNYSIKEMTTRRELEYHSLYEVTLRLKYKRCRYFFEISNEDETVYLFESEISNKLDLNNAYHQYFMMPWLNPSDVTRVPSWINDTVWYQIFPDRFCKVDQVGNYLEWSNGEKCQRNSNNFYGGNLKGIISKIPYLKDLGINGIYLTPIFKASSYHKYDTIDYYEIDPEFGSKEDFRRLIEECHLNNIKVMIDGVFNHTGKKHPFWLDVVKKQNKSKYRDWYIIERFPLEEEVRESKHGNYYTFAFTNNMPKLNTNNNQVIDYIIDVCKYWVKEFDVDGIRLDVANEISHKLNKKLRIELEKEKKDLYILGEIWHESSRWLSNDEYHAVMNYPVQVAINKFFNSKNFTSKNFEASINELYSTYQVENLKVMFNLLDSHDTARLINTSKSLDDFYLKLALLFSLGGSSCIYYGSEIVLEGEDSDDARRCMPWEKISSGLYDDKINEMKKLIKLHHQHPALKSVALKFTNFNDQVICFEKRANDEVIEVIINKSDSNLNLEASNIIYQRNYENNYLKTNGIIMKIKEVKKDDEKN